MNPQITQYLSAGFRLHPLKPLKKIPLLTGWNQAASNSQEQIEKWAAEFDGCNWGVLTGPASGITVVDVDPRNGGDVTWQQLIAQHGDVDAPLVRTPSGGFHLYFKFFPAQHSLGNGIDVLNGNNCVLPPSQTEVGNYTWEKPLKKLKAPPAWLAKIAEPVKGERNENAYKAACRMFRAGAARDEVVNFVIASFGGNNEHNEELLKTVESAEKNAGTSATEYIELGGPSEELYFDFFPSDHVNAKIFEAKHGPHLLYIENLGWMYYTGTHWENNDRYAERVFTETMVEQRDIYSKLLLTAPANERQEIAKRVKHFETSTNNRGVKNGVEAAGRLLSFATDVDQIDGPQSAYLLNFINGTVNLRTGALQRHSATDYISKLIKYKYVENAPCPFWLDTINKIFDGDAELIEYVQTMLGASVIGTQDARKLFIAHGPTGKNGKSTLFETLADILGNYADRAELKVIAGTDTGNLTELTTRMRIRGARLVVSSEVSATDRIDATAVKRLTGGDAISGRHMFKAAITFTPVCSIWLRTNALPMVKGADKAFWERMCIIPFNHQFVGKDQLAMSVVQARFRDEAEGILAWLVRGAMRWIKSDGAVHVPAIINELRDSYTDDIDVLSELFASKFEISAGAKIPFDVFYQTYSLFCKNSNVYAQPRPALRQALRMRGELSADRVFVVGYTEKNEFSL